MKQILFNKDLNCLTERDILAIINDVVDDIRLQIQNKIPSEENMYKSIDSMFDINESVNFPMEFLNSLIVPVISLYIA